MVNKVNMDHPKYNNLPQNETIPSVCQEAFNCISYSDYCLQPMVTSGMVFYPFHPFHEQYSVSLGAAQVGQKVCPYCRGHFKNSTGLNQHIGKVHCTYNKFIACHICGKAFKHKHAVRFHIKQVHEKKTRVKCDRCGKTLYNKYELTKHINKHHFN